MGGGHGVREKFFKVKKTTFLSSKTKIFGKKQLQSKNINLII
jgi:hypothetical protein